MDFKIATAQTGKIAPRVALATALLAGAVITAENQLAPASHAARPYDLLVAADRADNRGSDYGNTGRSTFTTPNAAPATQVFYAKPGASNVVGALIDNSTPLRKIIAISGTTLAAYTQGTSGAPQGVPNTTSATPLWTATLSGGIDVASQYQPQYPALSDDGNVYVGTNNGTITKYNLGTGAASLVSSGGAVNTSLKLAGGNIYYGDSTGNLIGVTTAGTTLFSTPAPGATAPVRASGQPAVNPGNTIAYFAVQDSALPNYGSGKVYAINTTTGAAVAGFTTYSVANPIEGALLLSGNTLIVADKFDVSAINATTGAQIWSDALSGETLLGSPALSQDGTKVYFGTNTSLHAVNIADGTGVAGFGTAGVDTIAGGVTQFAKVSPTIDSSGNILITNNAATIESFNSTTGALNWGQASGVLNPGLGAVSIDNNGTVYTGGTGGKLAAFFAPPPPTNTPTDTATATNTPLPTNTGTATNTATSTNTPLPTNTPTNTATATNTPNVAATQTAVAATATAAAGSTAPNCQLVVLPNPETIQIGGSEAALFKVVPGTTITATILGATYPTTVTAYLASPTTPGTVLTGTPVTGGFQYVFTAGPNGRALIDFPIPAGAALGKVTITATANRHNCRANGGPLTRTVMFNVEPSQASSFTQSLREATKHVLIRSVEAPPAKGSIVTDKLRVVTFPNANVNLKVTTAKSSNIHASGLEPGFASGTTVGLFNTNANSKGIATFTFPISSTLLIPGQGAIISKTVTIQAPGATTTSQLITTAAIREVRLKLILQPQETTRGNKKAVFVIGKAHGTVTASTFTTLVDADPGASVSGSFSIASANPVTGTAGPGGRVKLKFSVPNSTTPKSGTATLTVTSTFRGATVTRTLNVHYNTKK